jgi:hypothetical protein
VTECERLTIENGIVNGNMRSIGASITYECNQMYIAIFQAPGATCLANGTWSYTPDCTKGFPFNCFYESIKQKCAHATKSLYCVNLDIFVGFIVAPTHYRSYGDLPPVLMEDDLMCPSLNFFRHKRAPR